MGNLNVPDQNIALTESMAREIKERVRIRFVQDEIADQLHRQGFSHEPGSRPETRLYTLGRPVARTLIESELRDATIEDGPAYARGGLPSHPAQDLDAP